MVPCVTFSGIKENFLIRLHSSTSVYTRLVTRLHSSSDSSTFVCDSSTFVYTRLVTPLCFQNRWSIKVVVAEMLLIFIKDYKIFIKNISSIFWFPFQLKVILKYRSRGVSIKFLERINSYLTCLVSILESERSTPSLLRKSCRKKSCLVETVGLFDAKTRTKRWRYDMVVPWYKSDAKEVSDSYRSASKTLWKSPSGTITEYDLEVK